MRRLLPVVIFFAWAAPAQANVSIQSSKTLGAAPMDVTLTALGDAVTYHWQLGDGAQADGPVVQHRYEAGRYTATVTATGADGTTEASVVITSVKLTLSAPATSTYGRWASFHGRMVPALRGAPIALYAGDAAIRTAKADRKGRFRFRVRTKQPASYTARFYEVASTGAAVTVRPGLDVALPRSRTVGQRLVLRAVLRPRGSGSITVRAWRSGHELPVRTFEDKAVLRLPTNRVGQYTIRIAVTPSGTYAPRKVLAHATISLPYLSLGVRGASVRALERRLAELHYALLGVDRFYSYDTADAVLAFQKVSRMERTGSVAPSVWRRLETAHVPFARYPRAGHHIEVDKTRQVLFEVDHGEVMRVVHVSTGATGNTPVGLWHVYSKVPGFLPSGMFFSSFFLRGFAIHGYHSVPPYPASHGCVRIPIWIAPRIFASNFYGESIYVYY
jgi:PKD repeat protein